MIEWFKLWSKEIIITVIIATLVEIILPCNNTKKYVRMVAGLIVMYSIMNPIFCMITNKGYDKGFNIDKKIKDFQCFSVNLENESSISKNSISSIYVEHLKKDVSNKLLDLGYGCGNINILINDESYDIDKMSIKIISKDNKKKKAYSIVKTVEHIYISVSSDKEKQNNSIVDENEKMEILDFISETYGVDEENIEIK